MALERRDGGVYYYTSHRHGRRVVKRYGGSGEVAVACANLDTATRQLRLFDALDQRDHELRLRGRAENVRRWLTQVGRMVAEAMQANGWHQHKREWRRK